MLCSQSLERHRYLDDLKKEAEPTLNMQNFREPLLPPQEKPKTQLGRRAFAATLLYLCVGLMYALGWKRLGFTDATYFIVGTLLSVGYGDVTFDHDTFSLVFACFYLLWGLCLSAFVAGVVFRIALSRWNDRIERQIAESLLKSASISNKSAVVWAALQDSFLKLFISILVIISAVAVLMSRVEGWTLPEAFYWAVVTVSTVGYGDLYVTTSIGKWIAICFVPVGVTLTACFFTTLASLPFYIEKAEEEHSVLSEWGRAITVNTFDIIRKSGQIKQLGLSNNEKVLTRNEYILWLLLQLGKVDISDIKHCGQAFDLVDTRHEQKLELSRIDETQEPPPMAIKRGVTSEDLRKTDRSSSRGR